MEYEKDVATTSLGPPPHLDGDSLLWEEIDLHKEAVVARPDLTKELDDIQMRGGSSWCDKLWLGLFTLEGKIQRVVGRLVKDHMEGVYMSLECPVGNGTAAILCSVHNGGVRRLRCS
ncbi:hypothetical protein VE01_02521 [Pseudogymnoascus verrucosus]|uniref:Uncharacterized protein n=1 Tax=Pseudogymnoascus verrucosus TaxID=342668 RepID=A0A1B8GU68_9PEZI|nr:uncharacterized protein VE01_02521 [Pseudogymnoascus verrucosus]OBT99340.1 hypothetical protein VE01_02521 [Pseudogymnoascus verrucosus]